MLLMNCLCPPLFCISFFSLPLCDEVGWSHITTDHCVLTPASVCSVEPNFLSYKEAFGIHSSISHLLFISFLRSCSLFLSPSTSPFFLPTLVSSFYYICTSIPPPIPFLFSLFFSSLYFVLIVSLSLSPSLCFLCLLYLLYLSPLYVFYFSLLLVSFLRSYPLLLSSSLRILVSILSTHLSLLLFPTISYFHHLLFIFFFFSVF
ncbi:unnamed protein product [Acanthosepion pharaonis]|uniref:Uncharacterized protein n=1 Tax=Acanthosepion pharaonis TaxID=158019 RepID=A0A812BR60_ACAPH|nr:unnamed protein product [Sepia pharaonis]